jgi:hypothetical protein
MTAEQPNLSLILALAERLQTRGKLAGQDRPASAPVELGVTRSERRSVLAWRLPSRADVTAVWGLPRARS